MRAHLELSPTVAKVLRLSRLTLFRRTGRRSGLLSPLGSHSFVMAVNFANWREERSRVVMGVEDRSTQAQKINRR